MITVTYILLTARLLSRDVRDRRCGRMIFESETNERRLEEAGFESVKGASRDDGCGRDALVEIALLLYWK